MIENMPFRPRQTDITKEGTVLDACAPTCAHSESTTSRSHGSDFIFFATAPAWRSSGAGQVLEALLGGLALVLVVHVLEELGPLGGDGKGLHARLALERRGLRLVVLVVHDRVAALLRGLLGLQSHADTR